MPCMHSSSDANTSSNKMSKSSASGISHRSSIELNLGLLTVWVEDDEEDRRTTPQGTGKERLAVGSRGMAADQVWEPFDDFPAQSSGRSLSQTLKRFELVSSASLSAIKRRLRRRNPLALKGEESFIPRGSGRWTAPSICSLREARSISELSVS